MFFVCVVVKTLFPSENSWEEKKNIYIKKIKGRGFLKDFSSKGMGKLKACRKSQQLGEREAQSGQDVSELNFPAADLVCKCCSEFLLL